jgi:two-component system, OmpR family, sensor kinase
MLRSFRVRLIIAFLALFAAVSVTVSFLGMLLREQQVNALFDSELELRKAVLRESIGKSPVVDDASINEAVRNLSGSYYFRDFYVQVYDEARRPVAQSLNLRGYVLPLRRPMDDLSADAETLEHVIPREGKQRSLPERLRSTRLRLKGADGKAYLAIIAADPAMMNESIRTTRLLFLAGNLGGLAAAGAAAWFVTGAMSRRLEELVDQIETVGPDNLTQRISVRDRDEISELAGHLNAMLGRLKAGFDTQERFIHDASHELKTPVATVQAEAQALLLSNPSREELIEFVNAANDEMRRLGRLTEALLLLTRTSDTVLTNRFMPLELHEATTSAIRHLSTMATDHQVRVQVTNTGPHNDVLLVRCDSDLLEAMISNLVRNAIRFSPRNGKVMIHVDQAGEDVSVTVEDEGPGLPADVLPRIFDRYFESSAHKVRRGAGLGLAIASTVARLHGGSIAAANRPEGGAMFTVRLPRYSGGTARV